MEVDHLAFNPTVFDTRPASEWLPAVFRALDEQHVLCSRLAELGEEQAIHVESGKTDELMRVLGDRQQLLDRIVRINTRLEPFRSRREAIFPRLTDQQRGQIEQRIESIAGLVDRVRRRDDQDRQALEKQRKSVAEELAGIGKLKGAVAAYAGAAETVARSSNRGARFQDHLG